LKDVVYGQDKVNETISKRLAANDITLESIHSKMDELSSAIKSQLSFKKMLETQLAQLAAAIPSVETGKIPGQPEASLENVNAVTTSGGRSTLDPPHPTGPAKGKEIQEEEPTPNNSETAQDGRTAPQEFVDTNILLFPHCNRETTMDE
jgi:hypothetical protein